MQFFNSTTTLSIFNIRDIINNQNGISESDAKELTKHLSDEDILNYAARVSNLCDNSIPAVSVAAIEIFISVVGLAFNGFAIFFILMFKNYKKSISHWYILHLAIADILFLGLLPLHAHEHLTGKWNFPLWICRAFQGIFFMNYYAGIIFLTAMSFDRYIAIVHAVSARWRRIRTYRNAVVVTIIIWILAFLLSLPIWIFADVLHCKCGYGFPSTKAEILQHHGIELDTFDAEYDYSGEEFWENFSTMRNDSVTTENSTQDTGIENRSESFCRGFSLQSYRVWLGVNFAYAFVLPLVVMTICYSLVLRRVLRPTVSTESSSRAKRIGVARKYKITGIVVSLVVVFVLCWSPLHIVQLVKLNDMRHSPAICTTITDVVSALAFSNSMLNPILYTFLGSDFYLRFRNLFRRQKNLSTIARSTRSSRTGGTMNGRSSIVCTAQKSTSQAPKTSNVDIVHFTASVRTDGNERNEAPLLEMTTRVKEESCGLQQPSTIATDITDTAGFSVPSESFLQHGYSFSDKFN